MVTPPTWQPGPADMGDPRKNDREVVTVAVMQWGEALQYASRSLQKDPEILRLAMAKDPRAFCRAGKILRKDQTFATWAVARPENGRVLVSSDTPTLLTSRPRKPFCTYQLLVTCKLS